MKTIALLVLLSMTLRADTLSVGFGEADITPTLGTNPVYLAGFGENRKATKVHDPLMARAVVLDDGKQKIAMVSADLVGLFLTSTERVRKRLPDFAYVLVSSTHNHSGPDTLGLWGSHPLASGLDDDYLKFVEDRIVDAVTNAAKTWTPVTAEIGKMRDADLVNDNREPYVKHDELVVLRFNSTKDKSTVGLLVQWNCHPELLDSKNTAITADHVGYTVKSLHDKHNCPVAYFSGTLGGLMTALGLKVIETTGKELDDGTFEKAERYGTLVAELADKALAKAEPVTLTPFNIKTQSVLFRVDNGLYQIAWQVGKLKRPLYLFEGDPLAVNPVEAKNLEKPVAIRSEIGLLILGDLGVPIIPGEIYPELVLSKVQDPADKNADFPEAAIEPGIYAQVKSKHKMIIGLGNDELGYFIPKRQWDLNPPFCYNRKKAQYGEINSIGPDAAAILCETFQTLARRP
ncbi:hypothetical protein BH11PLA2_BH11PLA2_35130 [soil metagenome]